MATFDFDLRLWFDAGASIHMGQGNMTGGTCPPNIYEGGTSM